MSLFFPLFVPLYIFISLFTVKTSFHLLVVFANIGCIVFSVCLFIYLFFRFVILFERFEEFLRFVDESQ
jgi:hypothetical protein